MKRKCRKLLSLLTALCLVLSMTPLAALAVETDPSGYWTDNAATGYQTSVDASGKTVTISSEGELALFAKQVNEGSSYAGYTISITKDLDMSAYYWNPIDTATLNGDTGVKEPKKKLDNAVIQGNGYTITGIITNTGIRGPGSESNPGDGQYCYYYSGFIGRNDGVLTIENLTFKDADIKITEPAEGVAEHGSSSLAVIAGYSNGALTLENVNIDSCKVSGEQKVGGFIGQGASPLTVEKCSITNSIFEADYFAAPINAYAMDSQYSTGTNKSNIQTINGIKLENNQSYCREESEVNYKELFGASYADWAKNSGVDWYLMSCDTLHLNFPASAPLTASDGTKYCGIPLALVAEVGGYSYPTLQAAITAAGAGEVVTLLEDTTENVVVGSDKSFILELNGKTLSGGSNNGSKPALTNNGTVVIQDNAGNGTIKREDVNVSGYYVIDNQGTMTIESGNVYNNTGIAPQGASLIRNAGKTVAATLTIKGGNIKQDGFIAVKNDDLGKLFITGGTITATGTAGDIVISAVQNWSEASITGGTFNGAIWTSVWSKDFANSKTTIDGENVFVKGIVLARCEADYDTGDKFPEVLIENGKFDASFQIEKAKMAQISGGYYTSNVKDYVVEDKVAVKGSYTQDGVSYAYQVTNLPAPIPEPDKIVSASAEVKDSENNPVSGEAAAVSVGDGILRLTGKISSANKIVVNYQTKDAPDAKKIFTVMYEGEAFTATGDNLNGGVLTVGTAPNTTAYTVDLTGLEILPAQVKVTGGEAKPDIPEKIQNQITDTSYNEDKLKETKAEGLEAAAAEKVENSTQEEGKGEVVLENGTKVDEATAIEKLGELHDADDTVTLVVQPYLDIKVEDYQETDGQKFLKLDIEPKYNVIATTATGQEEIVVKPATGSVENPNAVLVAEGQSMTVKTDVTLEIPIPADLAKDANGSMTDNLYIEHLKSDGRTYRYKATVTGDDSSGYIATFTVPNGFSTFTALIDARKGILYFDELNSAKDYTFADVGTALPRPEDIPGKTFSGWKIGGTTYVNMTDELLKELSEEGTPVTAEAVFTTNGGGGGGGEEPEEWVNPFKDVKEKDWFYDAVKYTNQKKLFGGTAADKFSPEDTMTRGMLVTVLHRLEGESAVDTVADFSDVKATEYYAKPVNWAAANKIVGGFDGKFNPEDPVTREEMAAILHRYAAYKAYDVSDTATLDSFRDGGKTSSWAVGDMKWAVGAGMIYGRENNTLAPGGTATRAEVAQIMMRFCEKFITE